MRSDRRAGAGEGGGGGICRMEGVGGSATVPDRPTAAQRFVCLLELHGASTRGRGGGGGAESER